MLLFTASQTVYLFRKLELVDVTPSTVVGFRSLDEVIAMMIVFNITVFIIFVVMVVYQTITSRTWALGMMSRLPVARAGGRCTVVD